MALILSLSHNNSVNTRPRTERADKNDNHPSLGQNLSHRESLGEGAEWGWSFSKVRGMMFKHKNKCFPFQKHYLFLFFFFFLRELGSGVVVLKLAVASTSWQSPGAL